jgi:starch synthase
VIETIKKLNWVPDIIHFNGWMASFIPIYLKNYYKTDSYFNDTKLVLSVYNEKDLSLGDNITEKLKFDNIENLKALEEPTIQSFVIESMNLVDTIVKGDEFLEEKLDKAFEESKTPKNEYVDGGSISEIY